MLASPEHPLVLWFPRYTTGHIWACPPSEGDDYIFHCHPVDQKIPKPKRLQEWYKKMLDKAVAERIVHDYKVHNLFIRFAVRCESPCIPRAVNMTHAKNPVKAAAGFLLRSSFCLQPRFPVTFSVHTVHDINPPSRGPPSLNPGNLFWVF